MSPPYTIIINIHQVLFFDLLMLYSNSHSQKYLAMINGSSAMNVIICSLNVIKTLRLCEEAPLFNHWSMSSPTPHSGQPDYNLFLS